MYVKIRSIFFYSISPVRVKIVENFHVKKMFKTFFNQFFLRFSIWQKMNIKCKEEISVEINFSRCLTEFSSGDD